MLVKDVPLSLKDLQSPADPSIRAQHYGSLLTMQLYSAASTIIADGAGCYLALPTL
jgi:hypothetical protein